MKEHNGLPLTYLVLPCFLEPLCGEVTRRSIRKGERRYKKEKRKSEARLSLLCTYEGSRLISCLRRMNDGRSISDTSIRFCWRVEMYDHGLFLRNAREQPRYFILDWIGGKIVGELFRICQIHDLHTHIHVHVVVVVV